MLNTIYIISWLIYIPMLIKKPFILFRPSAWVAIGIMVRINGAAAFADSIYANDLDSELTVRAMPILFVIVIAVWILLTPGLTCLARDYYKKCLLVVQEITLSVYDKSVLKIIVVASCFIVGVYLFFVPIQSSGLVAVFVDPLGATMARENSLKLIGFTPIKYGYLWYMEILAPLLVGMISLIKTKNRSELFVKIFIIIIIVLSVMLTGARTPAGLLMVMLSLVYIMKKGFKKGLIVLVSAVTGAVVVATIMTIFREGAANRLSFQLFWDYLSSGLFVRVFVTPFETGVMTNLYAQENGLLGISNIRPLAILFGQQFVHLPNVIGLSYMHTKIISVSANTCFLFDYQASFGVIPGWYVSLVLLAILDFLLLCYRNLKSRILIIFMAALLTSSMFLISSAYTTSLITHGILIIPLMGLLLGNRIKKHKESQ